MTQWTNDPGAAPPSFEDTERDDAFRRPTRVLEPAVPTATAAPTGSGRSAPGRPVSGPPPVPVAGLPFSPPAGPPMQPAGARPAAPSGGPAGGFSAPPPPAYPPIGGFNGGGDPVAPARPARRRLAAVALAVGLAVLVALLGFGVGRAIRGDDGAGATAAVNQSGTARTTSQQTDTGAGAASTPTTPGQDGPRTEAPTLDPSLAEEPAAAVNKAVSPAVVQIETSFGLGTGFIYDGQGYILTAAHVVSQSSGFGGSGFEQDVTVRLADGSAVQGTVLGADLNNDVAVVKIDPVADIPVAALALEDQPEVGTIAIAIGSPFGLDQTVTQGIVSAVNRPVASPNDNIVSMIQTDAAINSGNSGGPLVNREGKVIGVNTQIRTDSGDNAGIGFAVPIDLAYDVAQHLVAGEPIRLGYLGIRGDDPAFGTAGAMIVRVEPASPAAEAGIAEGDVVTEADGNAIRSFEELASIIRATDPGQQLDLTVERDGSTQQITVTVGEAATN